jgi:hypothetical protein
MARQHALPGEVLAASEAARLLSSREMPFLEELISAQADSLPPSQEGTREEDASMNTHRTSSTRKNTT